MASSFCVRDRVFYFDRLAISGPGASESVAAFNSSTGKLRNIYDRSQSSKNYTRMMIYDDHLGYIVSDNYIYTHTYDWGKLKDVYEDSDCRYDSGYAGVIARIDIETGELCYIGSN